MLVSLVVSVTLLEAGATLYLGGRFVRGGEVGNFWRIVGELHPDLGWRGQPHARGRVVHGEMDYSIRLNSRGFRDPEREVAKRPGLTRILTLGDSVAWGWGVNQGERFTDLLEERLGPKVEVLNLACPGYGTDQQYWTLVEIGLAYEPDLVLLCVVANDVHEVQRGVSHHMLKPRYVREEDGSWRLHGRPVSISPSPSRSLWWRLVRRSALLSLATRRIPPQPSGDLSDLEFPPPTPEVLAQVRIGADRLIDPDSAIHHALTLVRDACRERGLPILVTFVPHYHDQYLYEPRFPFPEDLGPAPFRTYFTQRVAEACDMLGMPFVSVDDAFLERSLEGVRLHVGDNHPNAEGHRILADRLEPTLRAMLGL